VYHNQDASANYRIQYDPIGDRLIVYEIQYQPYDVYNQVYHQVKVKELFLVLNMRLAEQALYSSKVPAISYPPPRDSIVNYWQMLISLAY
jgi:hypothetical protein